VRVPVRRERRLPFELIKWTSSLAVLDYLPVRAENVIRSRDLDEPIEAGGPSVDDLAADSQDPTTGNTGAVAVTPRWDSVTARGAWSQLSRPDEVFGTHTGKMWRLPVGAETPASTNTRRTRAATSFKCWPPVSAPRIPASDVLPQPSPIWDWGRDGASRSERGPAQPPALRDGRCWVREERGGLLPKGGVVILFERNLKSYNAVLAMYPAALARCFTAFRSG
jgi:hypothetical protein